MFHVPGHIDLALDFYPRLMLFVIDAVADINVEYSQNYVLIWKARINGLVVGRVVYEGISRESVCG